MPHHAPHAEPHDANALSLLDEEDAPARVLPDFTPVPRQCKRHDGWTPERQLRFIEALADTGSVTAACRIAGKSTFAAYYLRRQPGAESFRQAWEAALDLGVQRIEDTAMDRALNGVDVPVYSYGKLVGSRRVYNDRLLMFMLRNRAPKRFAGGGARGLSAMDRTALARFKRDWRKEWEREKAIADNEREEDVTDELHEKLQRMQENWYRGLTRRTRAAYEEFQRLERLDQEEGLSGWTEDSLPSPDHDDEESDGQEWDGPEWAEADGAEWDDRETDDPQAEG